MIVYVDCHAFQMRTSGVNAVTSITKPTSNYLSAATAQTIAYNGFNKIKSINQDVMEGANTVNYDMFFEYGPDNARKKTTLLKDYEIEKTKYFIGDNYEIEKRKSGGERKLHYIKGGDGLFAIYVQNNGADTMYYVQKDYLGSFYCITDENGMIVENKNGDKQVYNFDPWGRRRNYQECTYTHVPTSFLFDRGYTGHEHMDKFGLINMNGRLYDPWVGRMLSPDPFVQAPGNSQSYNRYSYAFNNPLKYTDPTGYFAPNINRYNSGWNGMLSGVSNIWGTGSNPFSHSPLARAYSSCRSQICRKFVTCG